LLESRSNFTSDNKKQTKRFTLLELSRSLSACIRPRRRVLNTFAPSSPPSLFFFPASTSVFVAEIAAGAWGPPRLLSAMTPDQQALRLVNQQLKACL